MQPKSFSDGTRQGNLLEWIFATYHRQMEYVAFSIVQNKQDAEDAVQNAFVSLSRHIDTLECMEEFRLYYYVIETAKHKALDLVRSRRSVISYDDLFNETPDECDFTEELAEKDSADMLLRYIKELPDKYRDVLSLKYVSGLSNKEIADAVGRSETTVRKQLQRGREILLKRWKERMRD